LLGHKSRLNKKLKLFLEVGGCIKMPCCKSTPDKYDGSSSRIVPCIDDLTDNWITANRERVARRASVHIAKGFYLYRKHVHGTLVNGEPAITKFRIMYGEVVPVQPRFKLKYHNTFKLTDRIKYSDITIEEHDKIIEVLIYYLGDFVKRYVE
jgi:hypothetical protein